MKAGCFDDRFICGMEAADSFVTERERVREGFSFACNYEQARSDYPREPVQFLLEKLGLLKNVQPEAPLVVLELGCGTGKFTRAMLEVLEGKNVRMIASDPMKNMCDLFKKLLPDVELIQCPAENIGLPDASVDAVIAPQCFHWFTNQTALSEITRVLVPGGQLGILWRLPDLTFPWVNDVFEFLLPLFKAASVSYLFEKDRGKFLRSVLLEHVDDVKEDSTFQCKLEQNSNTAYEYFTSFSVIQSANDDIKIAFKKLFDQVIEKHFKSKGKTLDHMQFRTYIYWCKKRSYHR